MSSYDDRFRRRRSGDGPTGAEAFETISARLSDLFGTLKSTVETLGARGETSGRDEDAAPRRAATTSFGWRVRMGDMTLEGGSEVGGADQAEGPTRPRGAATGARRETAAPAPREAHVEVFDEADAVVVTAELPGVAEQEVVVELTPDGLAIRTEGARRFATVAALPSELAEDAAARMERRMSNGVFEARLPKRAEGGER